MTEKMWPQWTEEISERTVTGEDQLGVEGAAQGYQQNILPGIISVTDHARYDSFYAWILYQYIFGANSSRLMSDFRGQYFKRHEVALIIAAFAHHMNNKSLSGVVGSGINNRKARSYWEEGEIISLGQKYFQNTLGGFGQYYITVMEVMGIIAEPEKPKWVYRLTSRGKALAEAYQASIEQTQYFKKLEEKDQLEYITKEDAAEYGEVGCLCHQAIKRSQDRQLLLDTFFRFEVEQNNRHAFRRNSLGVALDLVKRANGEFTIDMLRPALYLGEYRHNLRYEPSNEIRGWVKRWQMVEIRHIYTFGLQCLWATFLLELHKHKSIKKDQWNNWLLSRLQENNWNIPLKDLAVLLCSNASLEGGYDDLLGNVAPQFGLSTGLDEYSLYLQARKNQNDSQTLFRTGVAILLQLYLRFFTEFSQKEPIWEELANRDRLPINQFFINMKRQQNDDNVSTEMWLRWLYQEYLFEQHEMMALEKLRYQDYDTFKFYFEDGTFHWPTGKEPYQEPIRLAGNRLNNCLNMLIDLSLIIENEDGTLELSKQGQEYHAQILRGLNGTD